MIDFRESGHILYVSSVDVSIGNGPGVNEREFIIALYASMGSRCHFLIPRPMYEICDLPREACTFSIPHRRHHPMYFVGHVLSQTRRANQLLSQRQFDMLLFRLDLLPLAPLYITNKYETPYALKTLGQGLLNTLGEKGGWLGHSLKGFNRYIVGRITKKALVADSVSMAQVEYLQSSLGVNSNKVVWIDNAVNTDRFFPTSVMAARTELGLTKYNPIAGYVGTRPWERGGMELVEATSRLRSKFPNLGAIVLGDGKELDELKKRARELKVENNCVFAGYVPFDKVPLYINSLDVGVSISRRSDRRAAAELKVRQYLACGKPVVVSPGSNEFVAIEDFGSIVETSDSEAIVANLDRWLSMTQVERSEFSRRAAQYMQDNLSIKAAIATRFDLWAERI